MAGPGRTGPPAANALAEAEYNAQHFRVMVLRCGGSTQTDIARQTGYSERQVRRIINSAFGDDLMAVTLSDYTGLLLWRVMEDFLHDVIEPRLAEMSATGQFDKKLFDTALATIDRMTRLAGLY